MFPVTSRATCWLTMGITALLWVSPTTAQGKGPRIRFDFPHAVECHDITSQEFARLYPLEKTIEAAFRVSARILEGHEEDLGEFVFEIRSDSERMRVLDYLPATTLQSDLVGDIEMKETKETVGTQGLSIGAAIPIPYGNLTPQGSPSADIGRTRRTTRTETSRAAPPSRVVVSSGTMHNEHGVFFKLRPSRDTALEDLHKFTVRFVVPRQWRGDWVQLTCRVTAIKSGFSFKTAQPETTKVYMGLHLAGDIEAQQAAHQLAHAQNRCFESNEQSVARRLASTFNQFVDHTQTEWSGWLAKVGLDNSADSLPASNRMGQHGLGRSPLSELQAACDALTMLGGGPLESDNHVEN